MDRRSWKRGALGEPDGVGSAPEAGAVASTLRFNQHWWSLRSPADGAVCLPIVELTPAGLHEWSHMQMARGRRSAMILLERATTTDATRAEEPQDYERAVGLLHEASPEAFQLAVYLCAGAFTIPVARLVQEVQFGASARQQDLSEVLLSGLLFTRTGPVGTADPNELYYEFRCEARAILLRSLREADANLIAKALEQRVSQYIEAVTGRTITFRALIANAQGQYDLPAWAQPFAQLGMGLLGRAPGGKTAAQVLQEFRDSQQGSGVARRAQTPATLARAAQLAASIEMGAPLNPGGIDPELWRELRDAGLLQLDSAGMWRFMPGIEPLLARIAGNELLAGVTILCVDDHPENVEFEIESLSKLGATIEPALDTARALSLIAERLYDVVISDMGRGAQGRAGMLMLQALRQRGVDIPTIIYSGGYAKDVTRRIEAMHAGAFACTNVSHELREWILEATGRALDPQLSAAQRMQLERLRAAGATAPRAMTTVPEAAVQQILRAAPNFTALDQLLQFMRGMAASGVNQILVVDGDALRVIAALLAPDKTASRYQQADRSGLIGAAIRNGERVWVPDVSQAPNYLAAEPSTRSKLVIPLRVDSPITAGVDAGLATAIGAVNIEMDRVDALSEPDIEWIARFCSALAAPLQDYLDRERAQARGTASQQGAVLRDTEATLAGRNDFAIVLAINPSGLTAPRFEDDARRMHGWLLSSDGGNVPATRVRLLLGNQATRAAFETLPLPPARRLYLYLAGHVFADDQPRSTLFANTHRRPTEMAELFRRFVRTAKFREIVVLLESDTSLRGLAPSLDALLEKQLQAQPDLRFLYASGDHGALVRGLTHLFIQGMWGAAAQGDAGEITSASMLHYFRSKEATAAFWTSGEIVLRPARATIVVFYHGNPPSGLVRILAARSSEQLTERPLNEGSAQFYLPPGVYVAAHESSVEARFVVDEAPSYVEVALGEAQAENPPAEQAGVEQANELKSLGDAASNEGRFDEARSSYERALQLFEARQDRHGQLEKARTLRSLGDLERRLDRVEQAHSFYERAMQSFESAQDPLGQADTLTSIGNLLVGMRPPAPLQQALEIYHRALQLYESAQEPSGTSYSWGLIAQCLHFLQRGEERDQALIASFRSGHVSGFEHALQNAISAATEILGRARAAELLATALPNGSGAERQ
jgi:CheY-like chemotaxis protein/tetratricopeptide (TPR) repeat protein